MHKIIMLPRAVEDLEDIINYLAQFHANKAIKQSDRMFLKSRVILSGSEGSILLTRLFAIAQSDSIEGSIELCKIFILTPGQR